VIDVVGLEDPSAAAAATYLAATLYALAREEHAGRRPRRLLEPALATWQRFRGRPGAKALAELLLEMADAGDPFEGMKASDIRAALAATFDEPVFLKDWSLPAGAHGDGCGPR